MVLNIGQTIPTDQRLGEYRNALTLYGIQIPNAFALCGILLPSLFLGEFAIFTPFSFECVIP